MPVRCHGRTVVPALADARGGRDANTGLWLRDAAAWRNVPTFSQLGEPKWFPYRYGQAVWTFLAEQYGANVVKRALDARPAQNAIARLEQATGHSERDLTAGWQDYVTRIAGDGSVEQSAAPPLLIGGPARDGK